MKVCCLASSVALSVFVLSFLVREWGNYDMQRVLGS